MRGNFRQWCHGLLRQIVRGEVDKEKAATKLVTAHLWLRLESQREVLSDRWIIDQER